jgi:hypothetical protein
MRMISCLVLVLIGGAVVYALSGEGPYERGHKFKADDAPGMFWPKPVLEAVNKHTHVYGINSDSSGMHIFFRGNTGKLNSFLSQMAETKNVKLRAEFIQSKGLFQPWATDNNAKKKPKAVPHNWYLHLMDKEKFALFYPTKKAKELPSWIITVEIYVDGDIDLGKIRLPLSYEASAGGRVGEFIALHERRRDELVGQEGPPTVEPGRGGFGDPKK